MAGTGWKPLPESQRLKGIATPSPHSPLALHPPVWEQGFALGAAKQICMP